MYNSKDVKLLAECYGEVLNEGLFDRFKKKKPEAAPAQAPAREEKMQEVMVFGKPRDYSYNDLMFDSKLVKEVPSPMGRNQFRIYETEVQDIGSYRDIPIFIPVVVLDPDEQTHSIQYSTIIGDVGQAHQSREKAMEELDKLAVKYKPKPQQMDLDFR